MNKIIAGIYTNNIKYSQLNRTHYGDHLKLCHAMCLEDELYEGVHCNVDIPLGYVRC
jgi:hypothetical protein